MEKSENQKLKNIVSKKLEAYLLIKLRTQKNKDLIYYDIIIIQWNKFDFSQNNRFIENNNTKNK